jgi:hypothetical protein
MGLIDRAFGADKNTMLQHRLALHWRMVASHHENYIKKNEMTQEQKLIFSEIQERSLKIAELANSAIKGFGIVSPEVSDFKAELAKLSLLKEKIEISTDKQHWLPEAIYATNCILNGDKRRYQRDQLWFSH